MRRPSPVVGYPGQSEWLCASCCLLLARPERTNKCRPLTAISRISSSPVSVHLSSRCSAAVRQHRPVQNRFPSIPIPSHRHPHLALLSSSDRARNPRSYPGNPSAVTCVRSGDESITALHVPQFRLEAHLVAVPPTTLPGKRLLASVLENNPVLDAAGKAVLRGFNVQSSARRIFAFVLAAHHAPAGSSLPSTADAY
ncbi:hypothetical protein BP6252_05387 [Coleophoma cylindrospora]|uniref:Uncharacterized protein n=1 Tax=Coleophoma cylindrospora TaxID=1849047 RepID=A0A3D8RU09_9HELO|nr:hypothetical protein BP6252_05387 [Coleophoma cylindrospora]